MSEKVVFYPLTKTIKINSGVTSIDFKVDIYSDGKEDWLSTDYNKYVFPVRSIGGNPVTGGKVIEPTFFLRNGWQIEPASEDHELTISGNIFHDDNISIVKVPSGYSIVVNLSTTISPDKINADIVQQASESNLYGGEVTVDVTSPYSGVGVPIGTLSFPVNNIVDAVAIANSKGFKKLKILHSMDIDSGTNIQGFSLVGASPVLVTITILDSSYCPDITIENCNVTGILDGNNYIINCLVGDLDYVNGQIKNSGLYGTIYLGGDVNAVIEDCYLVSQETPPTIDMGGSGQSLSMPNYTGSIFFSNLSSPTNKIGVGLNSGRVILNSSISDGSITISGIGLLIDNSTGGTIDVSSLISKETITEAVWDELLEDHILTGTMGRTLVIIRFDGAINIDTERGQAGTTYPIGTVRYPVNNMLDASVIDTNYGFNSFVIAGSCTGIENREHTLFRGRSGFGNDSLDLAGFEYSACIFENLALTGDMTGSENCTFSNCYINGVENISGEAIGGRLNGDITIEPAHTLSGVELVVEGDFTTIDLQSTAGTIASFDVNSGYILFKNSVDDCLIEINLRGGEIEFEDSCIGGEYYLEGYGKFYDSSSGMVEKANNLLYIPDETTITESIWAKELEGTFTIEEVLRIGIAVLAGKTTGGETNILRFRDLLDTKDRVVATVDSNSNRLTVVLDGE